MNSTKCQKCGLTNFATELECKRCATSFVQKTPNSVSRPKFLIIALVMFAGAVFYYVFTGVPGSVDKVNSVEANRVNAQPVLPPDAGRSRAEYDRYRRQTVANAVGVAPGLAEHTNRTQQTDKAIDQMSNARPQ